jgi:hypothetical protein
LSLHQIIDIRQNGYTGPGQEVQRHQIWRSGTTIHLEKVQPKKQQGLGQMGKCVHDPKGHEPKEE